MAESNDIQATSPPSASPEPGNKPATVPVSNDEDEFFGETAVVPVVPVETPAPVAPAVVPPPAPKHSSRTLREARDLGLEDSYIQSVSPDALEEVVYHLNRQARQKPAEKPALPVEEPIDWGTGEDGKPMTEKDYAPAVVRAIKQDHAREKRLKELEAEVQGSRQRETQKQQAQRSSVLIDAAFAALGAGYAKHFGTEPGNKLDGTVPEMKKRIAILRAAGITMDTVDPARINSQVKEAVELLGLTPEVEDPLKDKKDRWNRGGTALPTARNGTKAGGEDGAKKEIASILRKNGFETTADNNDEDEASIPD